MQAISDGVAYLPEDRKTQGLILDHSIRDNYALPSLGRLSAGGLVQHRKIDAEAQQYMERLRIKAPSMHTVARQLSGGNQQKAVVAKWLGAQTKVLIFDEPTRGIDINGRREIYRVMEELLEQGVGILMLTSDYTEALEMSHRILVMRRGSIAKEFQRGEPTESDILREAIGEVPGADSERLSVSGSERFCPAGCAAGERLAKGLDVASEMLSLATYRSRKLSRQPVHRSVTDDAGSFVVLPRQEDQS